jgi:hypothetical protein
VTAIHFGRSPAIIKMLATCGRIDWGLKDRDGFNVLHLSVLKNDLKYVTFYLFQITSFKIFFLLQVYEVHTEKHGSGSGFGVHARNSKHSLTLRLYQPEYKGIITLKE